MGATFKTIVGFTLAGGIACFVGATHYSDELIAEAIEKDARPARAIAYDRSLPFAHPIDYRAVVCQRSYYSERPTCRYYVERGK